MTVKEAFDLLESLKKQFQRHLYIVQHHADIEENIEIGKLLKKQIKELEVLIYSQNLDKEPNLKGDNKCQSVKKKN